MASNPEIPQPDTITPQSPPETPPMEPIPEHPYQEPPEITPDAPNVDEPGRSPDEFPGSVPADRKQLRPRFSQ